MAALCFVAATTPLFASEPLPRATPESKFIDPVRLQAAFNQAAQLDHLWWLDRSLPHDAFTAWGWGGQFVFCVPALGLVVAAHSDWKVNVTVANRQEEAILDIIVDRILPAVESANPPPRRSRGRAGR